MVTVQVSDDKVVQLRTPPIQHDIVAGLRNLADKLEAEGAAAYNMTAVTTVNVMLGYSNTKPENDGSGDLGQYAEWQLFSWGPKTDPFTVRGLLATVMKGH